MNVVLAAAVSSQCSSGCESGWTLYLEHSCSGKNAKTHHLLKYQKMATFDHEDLHRCKKSATCFCDDDQKEDLSMVSDASSGPPHFDHDIDEGEDEGEIFCDSGRKKQSVKKLSPHKQYLNADDIGLDDTASSPIFTSKKNGGENKGSSMKRILDYSSQGFSATPFHQGRSTNLQEHYGFIIAPFSTNQFQHNQLS